MVYYFYLGDIVVCGGVISNYYNIRLLFNLDHPDNRVRPANTKEIEVYNNRPETTPDNRQNNNK